MMPLVGGSSPRMQSPSRIHKGIGMRIEAESHIPRQTLIALQDSLEMQVPQAAAGQQAAQQKVAGAGQAAAVKIDEELAAEVVRIVPGASRLARSLAGVIGERGANMVVSWFTWVSLMALAEWIIKILGGVVAAGGYFVVEQGANLAHCSYRFCYPELEWLVRLHCAIARSESETPPAHGLLQETRLEALAKPHTFGGSGPALAGALNAEYLRRGRRSLTTTRRAIVPELCKVDVLPVHAKAHKNKALANMLFAADLPEDALPFALAALHKKPHEEPQLWNAFCDAAVSCGSADVLRWAANAPGLPEARRQEITTALASKTAAAPAAQPQGA